MFATHNAFRAPGAASIEELREGQAKVDYYTRRYDPMRRAIIPHPVYITQGNVNELLAMDFVFLAMDSGEDKKVIVDRLSGSPVPFIDTGIGLLNGPGGLRRVMWVGHMRWSRSRVWAASVAATLVSRPQKVWAP